jgi:hypothetical protein
LSTPLVYVDGAAKFSGKTWCPSYSEIFRFDAFDLPGCVGVSPPFVSGPAVAAE